MVGSTGEYATILPDGTIKQDLDLIIETIQLASIGDKLLAPKNVTIEDLQAFYYNVDSAPEPELKADLKDPKVVDIAGRKIIVDTPMLQDSVAWSELDVRRMDKTIFDVNTKIGILAKGFGTKITKIVLSGATNPAITGLMARGTNSSVANVTATSYAEWRKMIASLMAATRSETTGIGYLVDEHRRAGNVFCIMTDDVFQLAESTLNTAGDQSSLEWLESYFGMGNIFQNNLLGASVPNTSDGSTNIMLGIRDDQYGFNLQTPLQSWSNKKEEREFRQEYFSRISPVVVQAKAFQYEDNVVI